MRIIIADEIKYALKDDKNYDIYWITSESNVFEWAILLIFGGIFSILFGLLTFGTGTLFVMSVVASNLISFIQVAKQFYKSDQQAKLNANIFAESLINAINKFNQLLNQDKKIKTLFKHKQNLKLNLYTKGGSGLVGGKYKTWIKFGDGQQESFVNFNPFRMIALLQLVRDNNNKDTIDALIPVLLLYDTSIKRYGYYKVNNVWYDFENLAPIIHFELKLDNCIVVKHFWGYDVFYLTSNELNDNDKENYSSIKTKMEKLINKVHSLGLGTAYAPYVNYEKQVYDLDPNKNSDIAFIYNKIGITKPNLHYIHYNDYREIYIGNTLNYQGTYIAPIDKNQIIKFYTYKFVYRISGMNKDFYVYTFKNLNYIIRFNSKIPAMNIFDLLIILNNYKQILFREQLFFKGSDGNIYLRTNENFHNEIIDVDKHINILGYNMTYQVYTPDEIPELDLDYEIIRNENNYTLKIDKITILPIRIDIYDSSGFKIHSQMLNEDLIINLNYNENYKINYYLTRGFDLLFSFQRIGNLYEKIINIPKQSNQDNSGGSGSGNIPFEIKPIDKPKKENKDFKPSNFPLDSKIVIPLALLLTLYAVFKNKNEN